MVDYYIKKYISNLNENKIKDFGIQNGINLTDEECKNLYETVKKNWFNIIHNDYKPYLDKLNIDENKKKKIDSLASFYKEKYKDYL